MARKAHKETTAHYSALASLRLRTALRCEQLRPPLSVTLSSAARSATLASAARCYPGLCQGVSFLMGVRTPTPIPDEEQNGRVPTAAVCARAICGCGALPKGAGGTGLHTTDEVCGRCAAENCLDTSEPSLSTKVWTATVHLVV
eukprot:1187307-Prorocentrum_minimum.AAC.1